ncbi:hypothetical protein Pyn_01034 [Prunus yedoensis var. nudiflora]|uniref:Uncharacterized protein n=1 Tax=Prunus yedoensis var. nudiflora TaxID=2094558 RepID=A0A314UCN0_PRUYE|nr:hypothetical protein Pyn_01034 [Prunus yedoensis var. nudiflora]
MITDNEKETLTIAMGIKYVNTMCVVPAAPSAAPEQEKGKEEYKDSKAITEPISFGQQKLASIASGGGQVIGVAVLFRPSPPYSFV